MARAQEDTKVIMAWSPDAVVLSFRGTASLTNVWADLQVPFPPSAIDS